MRHEVIQAVQAAGFDVYMRDPSKSWLYFTDGKLIGNLEERNGDLQLITVHVPNRQTGNGFAVSAWADETVLTHDRLAEAFRIAPDWAGRECRASVTKWSGIEGFRAFNAWNAGHVLVPPVGGLKPRPLSRPAAHPKRHLVAATIT